MSTNNSKKLEMNDLAKWSPWPARLLSIEPFGVMQKTPESVQREFGDEKWGSLLNFFANKDSVTLANVEAAEQNLDEIIPCYERSSGFYLATAREANRQQINLYLDLLKLHVDGASCLVELGAGYGSKILALSREPPFDTLPLYAAEYTQTGCDLIELIAHKEKKQIQVGACDFINLQISGLQIPENSIVFTSYSVHYVPALKQKFVNFISNLRPKVVVHFEPCYQYYDPATVHGLMCMRYTELNGYTRNIASAIKEGCLAIGADFQADRNLFGSNPFLPLSTITWSPRY